MSAMAPTIDVFLAERHQLLLDLHAKYRAIAHAHPKEWKIHTSATGGIYSQKAPRMKQLTKLLEVGDRTALCSIVEQVVKLETAQLEDETILLQCEHNMYIQDGKTLRWNAVPGKNKNVNTYLPENEFFEFLKTYPLEELRTLAKHFINAMVPKYLECFVRLDAYMLNLMWNAVGLPALRTDALFKEELEPLIPQLERIYHQSGLNFNDEYFLVSPFALVEMRQEAMHEGDCESMVVGRCEGDHYIVNVNRGGLTLDIEKSATIIPSDVCD